MSDIKINIIGEFNKKGFADAEKATIRLTGNFDQLRRSARRAFVAIAGFQTLKRSVKAFAENEAAVQNLTKSLDNLGFRFEAPSIVSYLENLEKATAVSKDELFPAFRNLANATLDLAQSQKLLGTALDISAGTGADLQNVTTALTRAFNGNYTSLGKVQNAYTAAELEAMGFSRAVEVLQGQFSGQAAAAADTYQAKIQRLNIALGDAAENLGEGVIDALEMLGGGDYERGLENIAKAGEMVGDAFRFAATGVAYFKKFWKQGLFATDQQLAEFKRDMQGMFSDDPAKARTALRERSKFLATEQRQTQKIRKDREAAAKISEKEKKNQLELNKARAMFDLEKIQIEAALKGKITDEERVRLQLMKAIAEENVSEVQELSKKLKEIQDQNLALAKQLTSFPKAADPFADWTKTLTSVQAQLLAIAQKKIVVDFIQNFVPTSTAAITAITNPSPSSTAIAAITSPAAQAQSSAQQAVAAEKMADAQVAQAQAIEAIAEATKTIAEAQQVLAQAVTVEEKQAAVAFVEAAQASLEAAIVQEESAAALEYAAAVFEVQIAAQEALQAESVAQVLEAEANMQDALAALYDASFTFDESVFAAYRTGVPMTEINVTVEGSVISAQDLAETITDVQYTYQKTGKGLLYSSTAI
jgi:hypothetical protein